MGNAYMLNFGGQTEKAEVVTVTVSATNTTILNIPYDKEEFPNFLWISPYGSGTVENSTVDMAMVLPTVPFSNNEQIAKLWWRRHNETNSFETQIYLYDALTGQAKLTISGGFLIFNIGSSSGASWNYSGGYYCAYDS